MASLAISIDPNAFLAGGALAVAYTKSTTQPYPAALIPKTIIPLGTRDMQTSGSAGFPASYSSAVLNDPSIVRGALQISSGTTTFIDSKQLERMGQWFKNSLADLVNKGILIVNIGGVNQTAAQIINLPVS